MKIYQQKARLAERRSVTLWNLLPQLPPTTNEKKRRAMAMETLQIWEGSANNLD